MKTTPSNPWAARFEILLDEETIRQRAAVEIPALQGLREKPLELAAMELDRALDTVFYPTSQCVAILRRFVGMAYAHCTMMYSTPQHFLDGVYSRESPLPQFFSPLGLTGFGGIGKSALVRAFQRIQVPEREIVIDDRHSNFMLQGAWMPVIRARSDPGDVLAYLCGSRGKTSELVDTCRKLAFRDGVPFLVPDEFQFATGSTTANARVTQMLLSLGYIGIPYAFVANYSLVRRLQKRPEEDRQRLLADLVVLLPDSWDSDDWQRTLETQKKVAPDLFQFDPKEDAREIHLFSGGRKRAVKWLLLIAFRSRASNREVVDLAAIRRAYRSSSFADFREESEILASQAITNKPHKGRLDLWCPVPLPDGQSAKFLKAATASREELVAEAALLGALTETERKAVVAIEKRVGNQHKRGGEVVPLKKRDGVSASELKQNANWLRDNL